jgi:hypothetical protein
MGRRQVGSERFSAGYCRNVDPFIQTLREICLHVKNGEQFEIEILILRRIIDTIDLHNFLRPSG